MNVGDGDPLEKTKGGDRRRQSRIKTKIVGKHPSMRWMQSTNYWPYQFSIPITC